MGASRHHLRISDPQLPDPTARDATAAPQTVHAGAGIPAPTITAESVGEGVTSVVVGRGREFRSQSESGSTQRQQFAGSTPKNEDDVLEVCGVLQRALNVAGASWGPFSRCQGPEYDVDATSQNEHGSLIKVQVTRVVPGSTWEVVGRTGQATGSDDTETLSDHIHAAITKKVAKSTPGDRKNMVLALDAFRSPGYVAVQVLQAYKVRHGTEAREFGYRGIWLVGTVNAFELG